MKTSGCMVNGHWVSHYDLGYASYFDLKPCNRSEGSTWQQGWRAARDSDMKLLNQFQTAKAKAKIMERLCEAMGIQDNRVAA